MSPWVTVRVPGKVMLAGEYVVLSGEPALAATLDLHLSVRLRPRPGLAGCLVGSNLWPEPRQLSLGSGAPPSDPLSAAVLRGMELYGVQGCELRVDSELAVEFGLGSSSALRLGVLLAMSELARATSAAATPRSEAALWETARAAYLLQKTAQTRASGYDIATQLVGGLVRFAPPAAAAPADAWPGTVRREPGQGNLSRLVHLFTGGRGAPTGQTMTATCDWLAAAGNTPLLIELNHAVSAGFQLALAAPDDADAVRRLCAAVAAQRRFFAGAPSFPHAIARALAALPGEGTSWSFKTTGAGGEDALLLTGPEAALQDAVATLKKAGWQRLPCGFETAGTRIVRGDKPHGRH